jgi:hypothetical protein
MSLLFLPMLNIGFIRIRFTPCFHQEFPPLLHIRQFEVVLTSFIHGTCLLSCLFRIEFYGLFPSFILHVFVWTKQIRRKPAFRIVIFDTKRNTNHLSLC